jgi:haloacetate dehalogenase
MSKVSSYSKLTMVRNCCTALSLQRLILVAWETYHTFFDQLSVTNSSVFDYQAGGMIDYEREVDQQNRNQKVAMPTHVLYSIANLGAQFDVLGVWQNYTLPSANVTAEGIGGGKGHVSVMWRCND